MYELEVNGGNVVKIFKGNNEKAVIKYNGVNYDLESLINLFEEKRKNSSVDEAEIQQFEEDVEMRRMVEDSEQDIEQGKVFSTKEVIAKVKHGDI